MIHFMSWHLDSTPLNNKLTTVRVVSKSNSTTPPPTPARLWQQLATVGWKKIADFRRFNSSNMGRNIGSPHHLSPVLVNSDTPSHFRVSNEYSISFRLASMLLAGSDAKNPNRLGFICMAFAPYSFASRANLMALSVPS